MPTILSQKIKENEKLFEEKFPDINISGRNSPPVLLPNAPRNMLKNFIHSSTIDILDKIEKWVEGEKKAEKVCAYCHDTKWMRVNEGRGKYKNLPCVWCRDGKEKLEADQLVSLNEEHNAALTLVQDFIKQTKEEIK